MFGFHWISLLIRISHNSSLILSSNSSFVRLDISFLIALISTISLSYFQAVILSKENCLSILCHNLALSWIWSKLFKSIHSFSERSFSTLFTYCLSTLAEDTQSISQKYFTATSLSSLLYFIIAFWASTGFQVSGLIQFLASYAVLKISFVGLASHRDWIDIVQDTSLNISSSIVL